MIKKLAGVERLYDVGYEKIMLFMYKKLIFSIALSLIHKFAQCCAGLKILDASNDG